MRVLLVDDHEIVWNGTRLLLERMAADIEPGEPFHFEAVRDAEAACALDADALRSGAARLPPAGAVRPGRAACGQGAT